MLSSQVKQVFYMKDMKLGGNWHVAQKVKPRNWYDIPKVLSKDADQDLDDDALYEIQDYEDIVVTIFHDPTCDQALRGALI